MKVRLLPSLWLVVLIVGLPQLSETVYTPSLPEISVDLRVPHSYVEYTLTIYLAAFAIGTLFWGWLSDRWGRKSCVLYGICIFILGSIGCYFSGSFGLLMCFRFIQGFGGSIGSVLGQAICRDSFHGKELSRVYAVVVSALSCFPAIGPIIGGFIVQYYVWNNVFLFLVVAAIILFIVIILYLPETHHRDKRSKISLYRVFKMLLSDSRVMCLAFVVAGCNGILFSYFAEGPFYFIKMLGLTPQQFGLSFVAISVATWIGSIYSRHLRKKYDEVIIIKRGINIIIISSMLLSCVILATHQYFSNIKILLALITILSMMSIMCGFSLSASSSLSIALKDFTWCTGTASSIFGFLYYCLVSVLTFLMGVLHNHTLFAMPLYFLSIGIGMFLVFKLLPKN